MTFRLCALVFLILGAAAARGASPTVCASNRIYDGGGKTIDARSMSRVFEIWNATNVTIRNWVITGGANTRVFDISGSSNVLIQNVTVKSNAECVVNMRGSRSVIVRGVKADTIEKYLVWADNSDGLTLDGCSLSVGSRDETGVRFQYGMKNVTVVNSSIRNSLNKLTAMRIHDGSGFKVSNSSFDGQVWVGPMGGNQGGQLETSSVTRRYELARRTTNVTFTNVKINGCLSPMAGLSGFTMSGGSIVAKSTYQFFGSCLANTLWSYPDSGYVKSGDTLRPQPSGQLVGVTFTAPGKSTINIGTNGPLTPINCTLNGKPLGQTSGGLVPSSISTSTVTTGSTGTTGGIIQGYAFNDSNGNGVQDGKETRATGKKIFLDSSNNGRLDSGEKNMYTNSSGAFTFAGLGAGTYHVRRVFPAGYTYSTPLRDVKLVTGQSASGITIGGTEGSGAAPVASTITSTSTSISTGSGAIEGYAFNDTDADGSKDSSEGLAGGKLIYIDANNNGRYDFGEKTDTTDSQGKFRFSGLAAGTYRIRREFPSGFTYSTSLRNVTLSSGQTVTGITIGSRTK
jgi:hypothetical protein